MSLALNNRAQIFFFSTGLLLKLKAEVNRRKDQRKTSLNDCDFTPSLQKTAAKSSCSAPETHKVKAYKYTAMYLCH